MTTRAKKYKLRWVESGSCINEQRLMKAMSDEDLRLWRAELRRKQEKSFSVKVHNILAYISCELVDRKYLGKGIVKG